MIRWGAFLLVCCCLVLTSVTLGFRAAPRDPMDDVYPGRQLRTASVNSDDPLCATPPSFAEYDPEIVVRAVRSAASRGSAKRGAMIFGSAHFACLSCHQVNGTGGKAGPALDDVGKRLTPSQIVEAVYWPKRDVKPEYKAWVALTSQGQSVQGYRRSETTDSVELFDPAKGTTTRLAKSDIEELNEVGTLMPDGLVTAMTVTQRADVVRFLSELGRTPDIARSVQQQTHAPAEFVYEKAPIDPTRWPFSDQFVNRDRLYDFYTKEARHFVGRAAMPVLLPAYPGIDGGSFGHWGNQNEATWASDQWNKTDLGSMLAAVFRGAGVTAPKGVAIRIGEKGELATCFDPQSLQYVAVWRDGFLKFSSVRHGFMDGGLLDGTPLAAPAKSPVDESQPARYLGFYRHGRKIIFRYSRGETEYLDAADVVEGAFHRVVGKSADHPWRELTRGGPAQWPQVFETRGQIGIGSPYAIDRIVPPFDNPWNALMFFSGHDFLPDGTAYACTMQGDVWQIQGLDRTLGNIRWKRFASGLNQPLGLQVVDGKVLVQGRDQLTRLHDLNADGEADYYECVNNAFVTSPAGHDFICGLERAENGDFYTASGNQGLLRLSADGTKAEVIATGFRNPDGLGLMSDGTVTVPCSEGEWTPASTLCLVRPQPGAEGFEPPHFGYPGPKNGRKPTLPLMYLPRGLDNSAGGQVAIQDHRWGPLQGTAVHLSFGTASHFLLLRDEVAGQPQGGIVPLPGEFSSGVHRGRFNPQDGQLYVTGMAGWGAYNTQVGCFERVRYSGEKVQLPRGFHVHQNGVMVEFSEPVTPAIARDVRRQFAQAWNYHYSAAYGSEEYSPSHRGAIGHDPWAITQSVILAGGRKVFFEIPDLQPVSQLHLHLTVSAEPAIDLFLTVHALDRPFQDFAEYEPIEKAIAAHPMQIDLATQVKALPNPWGKPLDGAREVVVEAGKNLSFGTRNFEAVAGEKIKLVFRNPDVVPHNFVLIRPGSLERIGTLANKLISSPEAVVRHYVPASEDVLVYTDIVPTHEETVIYFQAPNEPGRYPYLCTFPGHWMAMNGVLTIKERR